MAFDEAITGGTTSKIIEVMVRDSTTGQGKTGLAHGDVTASYCREGGIRTAITLVSGAAGDSYSSGKWCEVDSTNQKGLYQLHVPNAAIAVGVAASTVTLQASGMIDKSIRLKLQTPVKVVEVETDAIDADAVKADAVAKVQNGLALSSEVSDLETDIAIVQSTIDGIIGSDGVVLDTSQPNYAPAKTGDEMDFVDNPNAVAVAVIQSGLGTSAGQAAIQTTLASHTSQLNGLEADIVIVQATMDGVIGDDGVILDTSQPNYAPNKTTPPTVEEIDTQLIGTHGAGSWQEGGGGGSGSGPINYVITVDDGSDPLEGAAVRLFKDVIDDYQATTDADGEVTFDVPAGTYRVSILKSGYSFTAVTLVVSVDGTVTYSMTEEFTSPPTSPVIRGRWIVRHHETKAPLANTDVVIKQVHPPSTSGQATVVRAYTATSDGNGLLELQVIPGEQYEIIDPSGNKQRVRVLSDATDPHDLMSVLVP